jgi:hypothetical protein
MKEVLGGFFRKNQGLSPIDDDLGRNYSPGFKCPTSPQNLNPLLAGAEVCENFGAQIPKRRNT